MNLNNDFYKIVLNKMTKKYLDDVNFFQVPII